MSTLFAARFFSRDFLVHVWFDFAVLQSKEALYLYKDVSCFKIFKHNEKSVKQKRYFSLAKFSYHGGHFARK